MIRLNELLEATGGRLVGDVHADRFDDFAFDSRTARPGEMFLAVVTETGNGHDYILDACQAGATGVVCQEPPSVSLQGVTCVQVRNTREALLAYARHILAQRGIDVIGITGSHGKTSTKEAAAAVLATRYSVFKNPGNYSGRYGLPIALGRLRDDQHLAVLEMASDSLGEIHQLADVSHPRVGVVTAVGSSHIAYLGSLDRVAIEKGALVASLPKDGLAILNGDDPRVANMAKRSGAAVWFYGLGSADRSIPLDLRASNVSVGQEGTSLTIEWRGRQYPVRIPLIGQHHAYTTLAAAAIGLAHGLTWDEIALGLSRIQPLPGRTRLLEGINGTTLLDDSYSASPESCVAALATLDALPAGRRIVVLGDMTQLGRLSHDAHRKVGRDCARVADILISKGQMAGMAAEEAMRRGMSPSRVHVTYSATDASNTLHRILEPGDLVLLKGSAEARLEAITAALLRNPGDKAALPRQSRGWRQVTLRRPGRPTWVEIDLDAIAENVQRIVAHVGRNVEVLAVLKADAYGHGATRVGRTALNNGVQWLGVACLGEALTLRNEGIDAPILSLGYTPPWQSRDAILGNIVTTLCSFESAQALAQAATDLGCVARVHVKVDTGMGRLGLLPDEVLPFLERVATLPNLEVDGLFTHLAAADAEDLTYTRHQLAVFERVIESLRVAGLLPLRIHVANSAAILRLPSSHYNMVRLGIAMYGLNPSAAVPCPSGFRPALSFKCEVAQVKELPAGTAIGYGCTYRTGRPSRIAVIPVGYADGFRRSPRHWGYVLVRGERAPIVGQVCMDQTMIDVTDIPGVRRGDEVILIGAQGNKSITAEQVAKRLGTINYEVVSEILARVPRLV